MLVLRRVLFWLITLGRIAEANAAYARLKNSDFRDEGRRVPDAGVSSSALKATGVLIR